MNAKFSNYKFIVDYDDLRFSHLFNELLSLGYSASVFSPYTDYTPLDSKQLVFLFSPSRTIEPEFLSRLPANSIIFVYNCNDACKQATKAIKSKLLLYSSDAIFVNQNARITAQGCLSSLITSLDMAITDAEILIVGGGRLAKSLALILHSLGVNTHATTNDKEECGYLSSILSLAYPIKEIGKSISKYDAILNTIPSNVIAPSNYYKLKKSVLLVELASAPYGLDKELVKALDIRLLNLPSVPSRIAPLSSANLLKNCILCKL